MLSKLLSIIWKNLKIVFRTPSLIFLLVIGPLSLILLVGTAFSSNSPEGAVIGVVYEGDVPELALDINTEPYSGIEVCRNHLVRGKLEACVHLVEDNTDMNVKILVDDTRPQISQLVIGHIQGFLGLASDEITLASTTELINELNNFISFANSVEGDLDEFLEEVTVLQDSLRYAENSLRNAESELQQQETELLQTQYDLNSINDEQLEEDENEAYSNLLSSLIEAENGISDALNIIEDPEISQDLLSVRNDISSARSDVNYYHNEFNKGIYALRRARITVDNSLDRIDRLQSSINNQIDRVLQAQSDARSAEIRLNSIKIDLANRIPDQDFSETFAKKIAVPINVELVSTLPEEPTNIQKLFPLIAATVAMFISLLLANILTLSEIHSPAYLRTVISPMSRFWFILGIFLTNLILVALQMGVLFNTGWLNFGINIMDNLWFVIGFVIAEAMIFTLIGMLIAYLVNSEQTSILITTFLILFLFLISDAVFPTELMPAFARLISDINPLMVFKEFFRNSLFYTPNLADMFFPIVLSLSYLVLGFILVTLADFAFKRRMLK